MLQVTPPDGASLELLRSLEDKVRFYHTYVMYRKVYVWVFIKGVRDWGHLALILTN